jgi:hypothetical protein
MAVPDLGRRRRGLAGMSLLGLLAKFGVVLILVFACNPYFSVTLDCSLSPVEYDALEEFFVALRGWNWRWNESLSNSTQWNFPCELGNPCGNSWQGLSCELKSESVFGNLCSVVGLTLNSMDLVGQLPFNIGNFSSLNTLAVDSNGVDGTLPDSLGDLTDLIDLGLGQNQIRGTLPSWLYSLTKLESLLLGNNGFVGSVSDSVGQLTALRQLELNSNYFNYSLPSSLGDLTNLNQLSFYGNYFHASIPESIYAITTLEILQMGSIRLEGKSWVWFLCAMYRCCILYLLYRHHSSNHWKPDQSI